MVGANNLEALVLEPDELGESIGWHADAKELWRVDILRGLVHRVRSPLDAAPSSHTERFDGEVGFALPREKGGMVVGEERTLWLVDSAGSRHALLELDERPENRWNDAICDRRGRLWAGTFARDREPGAANLYRIDPDGVAERILGDLTISNGLGWLDGGTRLHFVDSPTQRIDAFDVDLDAGRVRDRRTFVSIPAARGAPDGLFVDGEGGTWVALFGGSLVRHYDRGGRLAAEVAIPVPHVTNVCLGGSDGLDLFVTTTRHKLSASEREALPAAGCVFHTRATVAGEPLSQFAG